MGSTMTNMGGREGKSKAEDRERAAVADLQEEMRREAEAHFRWAREAKLRREAENRAQYSLATPATAPPPPVEAAPAARRDTRRCAPVAPARRPRPPHRSLRHRRSLRRRGRPRPPPTNAVPPRTEALPTTEPFRHYSGTGCPRDAGRRRGAGPRRTGCAVLAGRGADRPATLVRVAVAAARAQPARPPVGVGAPEQGA